MARIGYIRVSTEEQNTARQWAALEQYQLDRAYEEKVSGKDTARPELRKMLEYVREGDAVYIESLSRLGRSTTDLLAIVEQFTAKGVGLVSDKESIDTATPQGKFVLTVFAALSQLERETTLQRQREGIDAARKAGKKWGKPAATVPAGWDKTITEVKAGTMTAVQAMKKLGLKKTTYYKLLKMEGTR